MIKLRDYQISVVRQVSEHYRLGMRGVLLQMPTGGGKTRTAAYIVDKYASTGRQVLWLVHREELLMQAALVFAEQGLPLRQRAWTGRASRGLRAGCTTSWCLGRRLLT